jgi:hypothetical protein
MKLSAEDTDLFYKLNLSLLAFTNEKLKISPGAYSPEAIKALPLDDKVAIRNALWEQDGLLESFLQENPFQFSPEELSVVESWKNRVEGRFILVSHLKSHSIFLKDDDQIAYGVLGLLDDLEDVVGTTLPLIVETVLLPFRDRIVYDGLISMYRISFGRGSSASFKDSYQQAKAKYGVVTSLPFAVDSKQQSEEELLKFYLKSKQNRDQYREDIWDLIGRKPALRLLYHQEMGKIDARQYRKRFQEIGIGQGWFALLEGLVVASGLSKEEAEQAAKRIVPSEKRALVYYFQLGKK